MSSTDNLHNSATVVPSSTTESLQLPELVSQLSPVKQLSFPDSTPLSLATSHILDYQHSPGVTRPLSHLTPTVTRKLGEVETGELMPMRSRTTSLRQPVVIRGTGKKSAAITRPTQRRRWVVQLAITAVIMLIVVGTLMAVLPAGGNAEKGFEGFQPIMAWAQGGSTNPNLLVQQAATVTAVTQDGYDPGNHQTYVGLPTPPAGSGTADSFTYGQCTFWADLRYHQLTGYWVPWGGNAYEWLYGARASGWIASSQPHVPSIVVLQPYTEGAGGFGHVAVVEKVNADGSVEASNWNWYTNGGGWARLSYSTFYPAGGVSFVWHP